MYTEECIRIGRRLTTEGLVSGNFGNMSVRAEGGFYVTGNGAFLDEPGRLVFVPDEGEVPAAASSEYRVHREIYGRTRHGAVVHGHPPHAIALSYAASSLLPEDSEGILFCPEIPVVEGDPGTEELAWRVADGVAHASAVIARGHGTFAAAETLVQAYLLTSVIEHACRIIWLRREYRA
ncbi:MAG: fuculose phosphate aldolase [Methanoculleus sp. SDB]|nr:MAG: fuculose phosphate aldolase [Methanoculleus sp. SDB]